MSLADLQNKPTMVYEPDKVSEYNYIDIVAGKGFVMGSRKELKVYEERLISRNLKLKRCSLQVTDCSPGWSENTKKKTKIFFEIIKDNNFEKLI